MRVITRLKAVGPRAARTEVELDGCAWGVIDTEVVVKHGLAKGRVLDESDCESLLREDAFVRARRIAAGLLLTRPRATGELRRRLYEYRASPPRKRRRSFFSDKSSDGSEEKSHESWGKPWTPPPPFEEVTVEAVIDHFTQTGALDDADFARRYIRHYQKVKSAGPLKIRASLMQLGVAAHVVDAALMEESGGGGGAGSTDSPFH